MDQIAIQVSQVATNAWAHSYAVASNFLILVVLTVMFILLSYRSRAGIISLLIAFYVGYALYMVFPYTKTVIDAGSTPITKAGLSIALYLLMCIFPYRFVNRLVSGGIGVLSVVPRFALSFLSAAFLLALAYHVFPVSHIYTFPEPMNSLFAPDQYFFLWFVAPLIGLLILVH